MSPHDRFHGGEGGPEDVEEDAEDEDEGEERGDGIMAALLSNFFRDGLSMTIRSFLLQLSFLVASAVAASLGTRVLAAHQIVVQLWLMTSYTVDAFAIAGNVIGAKIAALRRQPAPESGSSEHAERVRGLLTRLTYRLLLMGSAVGALAAVLMAALRDGIIGVFTADGAVASRLRAVWPVLAAAQPVNSLVFVYDGASLAFVPRAREHRPPTDARASPVPRAPAQACSWRPRATRSCAT